MAVQELIQNKSLDKDERNILMKKLAQEYLEKEKVSKLDQVIEKSRQNAKENRASIRQINHNSDIKEKMEILSFLKSNNGESQFSKEYLQSLSGFDLIGIYEDCMNTMPEAMEKAKEERAKAKEQNDTIFDDYNLSEIKKKEEKDKIDEPKIKSSEETDETDKSNSLEENSRIDEIADRLGVDSDRVVDAANYKHGKSLEASDELEEKGKEFVKDDGKGRQKPSRIHSAGGKLRNILNHKAAKAVLIAGAGVAAIALLVINAPVALGAAALALVGNEVNKGRKGR